MTERLLTSAIRSLLAVGLASLFFGADTSVASAQATGGWTLNITNDGPVPMPAGGELPFKFRIDNNDNVAKGPTTIDFTIPATTIYVGTEGLDNCTPAPTGEEQTEPLTVTCDVPALAVGASIHGTVTLSPRVEGTFVFEGDMADDGPSETVGATITRGADLEVELTLDAGTIQAGSIAGFSAGITNHGPYPADSVTLRIPIPAGLSADFTSLPADCGIETGVVICEIAGPIAVGATVDRDFSTQVITGNESSITITANIGESTPLDGIASNNQAVVNQNVTPGLDVSLQKTRMPEGRLLIGNDVTFTLVPRNVGGGPDTATITDLVPENYSVSSVSVADGSGWACEFTGNEVICAFDSENGSSFTAPITITAEAISESPEAGVTNTANIQSDDENSDMRGNNSANDGAAHIVPPIIDLVAHKSGPREGLVAVGNSYDYTLRSHNDGNAGYYGPLTITDFLPAGLKATAISAPAGWVCETIPAEGIEGPANIECTTDQYTESSPLGPQQWTGNIVLTVEVIEAVSFSNGMLVSFPNWDDIDALPGNNTFYVDGRGGTGDDLADIAVRKTVNASTVAAGDELVFSIEIINHGPAEATNVVLDDRLNDIVAAAVGGTPDDINPTIIPKIVTEDISCSVPTSSGYSLDLQCMVTTLPICTAGVDCPVIQVPVRPGSEGAKTNTAIVFSLDVPDSNPDNNSSTVGYDVTAKTDVIVSKTSVSDSRAGQPLVYTVAASVPRNGLSGADDVKITDTLPDGLYFVSATVNGTACTTVPASNIPTGSGNNTVECDLGRIENGSLRTAVITVIPTTELVGETIANEVTVETETDETTEENNSDERLVGILPPVLDLIISKTDDDPNITYDPVLKGEDTVYTITATNSGPADAFNVVITDNLPPAGFSYSGLASPLPAAMSCTEPAAGSVGGTVTCSLARLEAGDSVTLKMALKSTDRGQYENSVAITSDETVAGYEGPAGNNTDSERTTVRVMSDVGVVKTANADMVDLREEFTWTLTVTSHEGPGYEVAEEVRLTDTLPVGMELTKVPEITSGPHGDATCTGAVGTRQIDCDLGDMDPGEVFVITLHTKITEADTAAKTNEATVTTESFDQDPTNNTRSDSVDRVHGSSIAGTIWRDFNDNKTQDTPDTIDTGISGVTVTVTGTAEHDRETITATTTTDANGNYIFGDLPPGTYSVSYSNVPNSHLYKDGSALPGTSSGSDPTTNGANQITGIVTIADSKEENHDFTRVPIPSVGLAKVAGTPVHNAAGYYVVTYTLRIRNLSQEPLQDLEVNDQLNSFDTNFGSLATGAVPGVGEYAVESLTTSGFTGGTSGSGTYNGASNTVLLTGATLAPDATGTVTLNLRVNPNRPWTVSPLVLTNQAKVDAEGQHSGTPVTDLSDRRNNGQNTPAWNDRTTVNLAPDPSIEIVKTATFTPGDDAPGVGDTITYTFAITNTGNTPLFDVGVTDPLEGLQGLTDATIEELAPGATNDSFFTASYVLTQDDLDRGYVENTATADGTWANFSGEPQKVTDSATETVPALSEPGLELVKGIQLSSVQDPTVVGDNIRYVLTVTNIGNTNLRNVVITDALVGVEAEEATPFTIGDMAPGTSKTVYANYKVTLADIDAGEVLNTATASGVYGPGDGTSISSNEDSEEVPLFQNTAMSSVKVLSSTIPEVPQAGNPISWTVTVTNEGNVTLHDVTVTEPDFDPVTIVPENVATLEPGDDAVFTVTAAIRQSDIEAGSIKNVANVIADDPGGDPLEPLEPESETPLARLPGIELVKSVDLANLSTPPAQDDQIIYNFVIRNTGNVALSSIELADILEEFVLDSDDAATLAALTLYPEGSTEGDSEVTISGIYPLQPGDIDAGTLTNEATVTAVPPSHPDELVEDDDTTTTDLDREPEISLVKSVTNTAFSTPPSVGDLVTYGFTITNTGNVTIENIRLEDLIEGVEFDNVGNWSGPLGAGLSNEDAFTATYALTQADINRGTFTNEAKVTGSSVGGEDPDDVTDSDDATVEIERSPGLSIVKSYEATLSDPSQPDELITYQFLVTNTGNVTLTNVVVSDPLEGLVMDTTTIATLLPGEENAVTLTGTYSVTQTDIQAGKIVNQASVRGEFVDPENPDTPTPVGPVDSEEITIPLNQLPQIALIKEAESRLSEPAFAGEEIEYTFTVINTGNLSLTDIVIEDPLPGITPDRFEVDFLAPGERQVFTAIYVLTDDDIYPTDEDFIGNERVENQATATARYEDGEGEKKETNDLSGPDVDSDEPTIVPIVPPEPELSIVKAGTWNDDNGNTYPEPGETITYTFTVKNDGNAILYNVTPQDDGPEFNGTEATNSLSGFSPDPITLEPGEEQVFTATYVLSQEDIDASAGFGDTITNIAKAVGNLRNEQPYESPDSEARVELPAVEPSDVILTKQAVLRQVRRGDRVPYIIKVENASSSNAGPVNVIDTMPSGFRYVEESAKLDEEAFTPVVNGRRIVFENLQLGPNTTRLIELELLVLSTAGPGTHTNTASITDQFGNSIAKDAHAVVEILAEPVFDCGEIIGTVFDDVNGNGYQDDGEPGLPGVRVATVKGWLITTDKHGRFHVPCAALPEQRIGSNFIMKLDNRTLPTGYRVTTENPRVVRLTAGKMTNLNFGASISRVVRLDLQAGAFVGEGVELQPQWVAGLDQLIGILKQEQSVLRLNYTGGEANRDLAARRMSSVRDAIGRLWKKNGAAYQLEIETRIEVGQ